VVTTAESDVSNRQPMGINHMSDSRLAHQHGDPIVIGRASAFSVLLHDLGKYTAKFQARLEGSEERTDHSTAGAVLATQLAKGDDRLIADLVAYAIAGHHAGLPDRQGDTPATLDARTHGFIEADLDAVWRKEIEVDATVL